jgi:cobalt/nickel transport protein
MNKKSITNILLIVAVIALVVLPLAFAPKGAEFSGSDDQASNAIAELQPGFTPWHSPIWEPPSGEIESLLFAVQASLGTGFIAYFFGYKIGQRKSQANTQAQSLPQSNQV